MCPDDGYVAFYASELVSGYLEKSLLGGGAKASLFAVLLRDSSAEASALTMGRLAKITSRFLMDYGFSIGIVDVQPTPRLTEEKAKLLARGYLQCKESTPPHPLLSPPFLPRDLPNLGHPRPFPPFLPSPPLLTTRPPPSSTGQDGRLQLGQPRPVARLHDGADSRIGDERPPLQDPRRRGRDLQKGAAPSERAAHDGPMRLQRLLHQHLTDDCMRRPAVGGRQAHAQRLRPSGLAALPTPFSRAGRCVHLPQVASLRVHLPRMTSLSASECVGLPL